MRAKQFMNRGFTLVELLIVVIILAILAGIVVPQFASSTDDARSSAADSTLSNIRGAIDLYYQQHGAYPGSNTAVADATCTGVKGSGTGGAGLPGETAFLDQMAFYTNMAGLACSIKEATYRFGPYFKRRALPPDPFTQTVSTIEVVTDGNLVMLADTTPPVGPGGYKYDSLTGRLIINLVAEQDR